jgi:hypothetical protein
MALIVDVALLGVVPPMAHEAVVKLPTWKEPPAPPLAFNASTLEPTSARGTKKPPADCLKPYALGPTDGIAYTSGLEIIFGYRIDFWAFVRRRT